MTASLAVVAFNMAFIGALPKIFFRKDGALNAMWFATAAPFFACGVLLILFALEVTAPVMLGGPIIAGTMQAVGVLFSCSSIATIGATIGTHRVPLALWHQENDAPVSIVTYGPYSRVRHPFYTAFILGLLGALLAFPHLGTAVGLVYGIAILSFTAAREERRLLSSELGAEYRAYQASTGRFVPRLGRPSPVRTAR